MNRHGCFALVFAANAVLNVVASDDIFGGTCYVQESVRRLKAGGALKCRMKYAAAVSEWTMPGLGLPTNGVEASTWRSGAGRTTCLVLSQGESMLVNVMTRICSGPDGAQSALCEHFDSMTRLRVWPCTTNGCGDVAFCSLLPDQSHVVFCRNNVFAVVDSWTNAICATNIARQIDAAILRASGVPAE